MVLLFVLAVPAGAEGFRYSFVSASYSTADYDNLNADGDGLGVGVSLEISESFHVFGAYSGTDLDSGVDADGWNAGVGFHTPISEAMDVVVNLSYVSTEVTHPVFGKIENDGFAVGGGVRAAASEWIELNAGLTYADLDRGNDTSLEAGFLFSATDNFAIGVSGSWDDDVSVYSLNARLYFE